MMPISVFEKLESKQEDSDKKPITYSIEIVKRANEIADKLYETYGRDSDYLFCIPRSSVEEIVKFVLKEVEENERGRS